VKKLIFLLILALAFVGIMPAIGAAHPPGVITLDAVLSENSGYEAVVTSDTVLATQGFLALPASNIPVLSEIKIIIERSRIPAPDNLCGLINPGPITYEVVNYSPGYYLIC
jgi:hypothetical protein